MCELNVCKEQQEVQCCLNYGEHWEKQYEMSMGRQPDISHSDHFYFYNEAIWFIFYCAKGKELKFSMLEMYKQLMFL